VYGQCGWADVESLTGCDLDGHVLGEDCAAHARAVLATEIHDGDGRTDAQLGVLARNRRVLDPYVGRPRAANCDRAPLLQRNDGHLTVEGDVQLDFIGARTVGRRLKLIQPPIHLTVLLCDARRT
jgi:hypothetical protein